MGTDTTRKEMTLAVMEGICLAARQLAEVMCLTREEMDGLKVTGGGSKNEVWMQMLADVLGVRVQQMESTAGGGIWNCSGCGRKPGWCFHGTHD